MKKTYLHRICFVFSALLITMMLVPCGLKAEGQGGKARKTVNLVTNAVGSGLYTVSVAQAQAISRNSNIDVILQPTQGALIVPNTVNSGEAEFGLAAADYLTAEQKNLRAVQVGHNVLFAFVTGADSGIKTIGDLKGKKIQRIRPGGGPVIEDLSAAVLQAFGIDPDKDVVSVRAESSSKALHDVIEGRAAATFTSLGGSKMEEFDKTVKGGSYVVPFPKDKFELIRKKIPWVKLEVIPAGSLPGVKTDTTVFSISAILIANASVPDDVVYTFVKTLINQQKELEKIHPYFKEWTLDRAVQSDIIPFHPGAIKYYTERGVWKLSKQKKPKKK
ncbi:MAG: TAXI family TRAP transporter solute-binding subunit [Syntrophales bacterium]